MFSAVLTGACGTNTPAQSQGVAAPTSASASASPSPSASCENGSLSNPATGAGNDLQVEILHQQGGGSGWDFGLPAAAVKDFPEFTGSKKLSDFVGSITRALDEGGGFSYNGATLELSLFNRRSTHLTVHDIRVVNKRVVCPPDGLLFLEGNEGGDFIDIAYSLDAAAPVAHEKNESGEVGTAPYFSSHVIDVNPQDQVTVQMDMRAVRFAYEFDIAIDYTVGGKMHTQLVRRKHGPFRVTTSLCPSAGMRASMSESDADRLKAQHYGLIRERTGEVDAAGAYIYKNFTTAEFLKSCPTW